MLPYVHRDNEDNIKCCFTSPETMKQLQVLPYVHRDNEDNIKCCLTSTETMKQHQVLPYVHRDNETTSSVALRPRQGNQDGHLDFHTGPEL